MIVIGCVLALSLLCTVVIACSVQMSSHRPVGKAMTVGAATEILLRRNFIGSRLAEVNFINRELLECQSSELLLPVQDFKIAGHVPSHVKMVGRGQSGGDLC